MTSYFNSLVALLSPLFLQYHYTLGWPLDPKVDCPIKELAWDYAKQLLPQYGTFQAVYDALQLQNCNVSLKSGRVFEYEVRYSKPAVGVNEIFVDIVNGNDSAEGSKDDPLRTIERGVEVFRGKYAPYPSVIYLRNGTYFLTEPLQFGPKDSNLCLMGWENESVVISGGKRYTFNWTKFIHEVRYVHGVSVVDNDEIGGKDNRVVSMGRQESVEVCADVCYNNDKCTSFSYFSTGKYSNHCFLRTDGRWSPRAANNEEQFCVSGKKITIHSADLSGQDVNDFTSLFINGRRAVRARYPDGNPEIMGLYTHPSGYYSRAENWLPPKNTEPGEKVHITDPNRNGTRFPYFQMGIGGTASNFVPPQSFWSVPKPATGNLYVVPSGMQYDSMVEFVNRTWKNPTKGLLHTFPSTHWGNWIFQIDERLDEKRQLLFSRGGFQEARGQTSGAEWFVDNIFEELDSPGEWFLNFDNKQLLMYPNGTLPSEGIGTLLDQLIIIEGTQELPVTNFTISNIKFAHSAPTFMEDFEAPISGGDWSLRRSAAVFVEGADNFTIKNCVFDSPGGNALMLSNYIRNSVIESNEFVWVGDSAIVLIGSTNLMDGTSGNQPRGTKVIGNLVHENGIFVKQTAAFMQTMSCETELRGNVFFNGPRAGVNFNDGFGGGNLMEKNLIFNYVRDTGSHGPFNSWDRQPFLTTVHDGTPSLTPAESEIRYNFVIANYYSTAPLDHDDGSAYYYDHHNVLVYGGGKNNIGHSKRTVNNLFIYPGSAFPPAPQQGNSIGKYPTWPYCIFTHGTRLDTLPSGWDEVYANNTCVFNGTDVYRLLGCQPNKINLCSPLFANNSLYTPHSAFSVGCGDRNYNFEEWQKTGQGKGSIVSDLPPMETVISWAKNLLGIL